MNFRREAIERRKTSADQWKPGFSLILMDFQLPGRGAGGRGDAIRPDPTGSDRVIRTRVPVGFPGKTALAPRRGANLRNRDCRTPVEGATLLRKVLLREPKGVLLWHAGGVTRGATRRIPVRKRRPPGRARVFPQEPVLP